MEYRIILLEKDGVPISRQPYRVEKLILTKLFGITLKKDWVIETDGSSFNAPPLMFHTYKDAEEYINYMINYISKKDTPITRKVVTE